MSRAVAVAAASCTAVPPPQVSILIPVHNEAATVGTVLERVRRLPLESQIIVVDDVVYGSRFAAGPAVRTWAHPNRLGNRALSALTSLLYWRSVSDMETGCKLFRRESLLALPCAPTTSRSSRRSRRSCSSGACD